MSAGQAWLEAARDRWRAQRMSAFIERLGVRPHQRVLDLGGNVEIWASVALPLSVTLLNTSLERGHSERPWRHPRNGVSLQCVVGDACDLSAYGDGAFDIVFSNSVIEYLGDDCDKFGSGLCATSCLSHRSLTQDWHRIKLFGRAAKPV